MRTWSWENLIPVTRARRNNYLCIIWSGEEDIMYSSNYNMSRALWKSQHGRAVRQWSLQENAPLKKVHWPNTQSESTEDRWSCVAQKLIKLHAGWREIVTTMSHGTVSNIQVLWRIRHWWSLPGVTLQNAGAWTPPPPCCWDAEEETW